MGNQFSFWPKTGSCPQHHCWPHQGHCRPQWISQFCSLSIWHVQAEHIVHPQNRRTNNYLHFAHAIRCNWKPPATLWIYFTTYLFQLLCECICHSGCRYLQPHCYWTHRTLSNSLFFRPGRLQTTRPDLLLLVPDRPSNQYHQIFSGFPLPCQRNVH